MSDDRLPAGLQFRAPGREELEAVTDLIVACDIADSGEADTTVDDVLAEWERKDFVLAIDARVVVTSAGAIIGYTDVWKREADIYITHNTCVHPAYRGQGIERYLYHLAEDQAREHCSQFQADEPCTVSSVSVTSATRQLLEQKGYQTAIPTWAGCVNLQYGDPGGAGDAD